MDRRSVTSAQNGKNGGRPKGSGAKIEDFEARDGEMFRPIPCFDGYFASNLGRIVSVKSGTPKLLKMYNGNLGRPRTTIVNSETKKLTSVRAQRLVLMAFKGIPPEGMQASHIDGNPLNNNIDNLAWETHEENMARMVAHGNSTKGEANRTAKLKEDTVREIRRLYTSGVNMTELSKMFGVCSSNMHSIIKRKTWKHI